MGKEAIVFVPGVFGTTLTWNNGPGISEDIWPPGPQDIFGYSRFDLINDAKPGRTVVGNVLPYVVSSLFPVYSTVMSLLADIDRRRDNVGVIQVPYDWRRDIFESARAVSVAVDEIVTNSSFEKVTFVAHSMGGLVVRALLESIVPALRDPPFWCSLKRRALFACTPHLGAPKALLYAMGQTGEETLKPDQCNALFANPAFLAGCQLLPASSRPLLHDLATGQWLDYKSAEVVEAFNLSGRNIGASDALRKALVIPKHADYLFVYGTGLPTADGLDLRGLTLDGATPKLTDGDGTVPSWSVTEAAALADPKVNTWSTAGDHLGLLGTPAFRDRLHQYFSLPVAPTPPGPNAAVSIHASGRQFKPGAAVKIMLTSAGPFDGEISGEGLARPVSGPGSTSPHYFDYTAPERPGAYTISFTAGGQTLAQHWLFVESDDTMEIA